MRAKNFLTMKFRFLKQDLRYFWSNSSIPEDASFMRSIFAASSEQFVKSMGERTLKPVPSIDVKDNIKPYQLVVKAMKRKFIFFEKAVYYPTEFQLHDILTDPSPLSTPLSQITLISDFNREAKLSLKGKLGTDIAKDVLKVELSTKDSVRFTMEFDKVNKLEAHEPRLMKELGNRCVDLSHQYVQQIRQDPSKVLCVVSGVASLDTGGTIHRELEVGVSATLKANLIEQAKIEGGATFNSNNAMGLAPGTPMAYSMHELAVDKDTGTMQLVLAVGCVGGFVEGTSPSQPSAIEMPNVGEQDIDVRHPSQVLGPLVQLPADQKSKITTDLLYLMSVPRDLILLDNMLDEVEAGSVTSLSLDEVEKKLLSPTARWLDVLKFARFQLNGDTLTAPEIGCGYLQCVGEFLDAVTELDDDVVALLRLCSRDNARRLCLVFDQCMRGRQVNDANITEPLIRDEVAHQILQGLDFKVSASSVVPPTKLHFNIDEIYWVLYALWGI